ncbi:MAG TPA: hypothetical protein VF148_05125 [Acidimicrobiia bacterium]
MLASSNRWRCRVDDDGDGSLGLRSFDVAAEPTLPVLHFLALLLADSFDVGVPDAELADHRIVDHSHPAPGHSSHGQFRVPRDSQLSHDEDVERRPECFCHFERDWNPATREPVNDHVVAISIAAESFGELSTCGGAVGKEGA